MAQRTSKIKDFQNDLENSQKYIYSIEKYNLILSIDLSYEVTMKLKTTFSIISITACFVIAYKIQIWTVFM